MRFFAKRKFHRKLTARPNPERIGDESPTEPFSLFVHGKIWCHRQLKQELTFDDEIHPTLSRESLARAD
ncbi:UNVERIFIED_ORG: hypothetical protein GGD58_001925 [Rhizobium pisi]